MYPMSPVMCGPGAVCAAAVAATAAAAFRRRWMKNHRSASISAAPTTPPTTPPAMAPVLVEEEDEDDESESDVAVAVDADVDEIVALVLAEAGALIDNAAVYESFALNDSHESAHPTQVRSSWNALVPSTQQK